MKRSNAPIFWSLFGAGGMLAALIGPALVFITGIAAPHGWLLPRELMNYPNCDWFPVPDLKNRRACYFAFLRRTEVFACPVSTSFSRNSLLGQNE